jgi:hypothetical protein
MNESMAAGDENSAPVSGSCAGCGCALGYLASRKGDEWFCCGPCAGSDCCECGCRPELARARPGDHQVPTRRMFAARHPDGLNVREGAAQKLRAFPFADKPRGR